MLMGSILLQPTKFKQAKEAGPSLGLVGDLLDLILRIAVDKSKDGDISRILEEAARDSGERFVEQFFKNIDKAGKRMQNLLRPLLKGLEDLTKTLPETDDAAEYVNFSIKLITKLAEKTANLSIDQLRQLIGELLDIFQNDLGLNGDYIEQQVWALVDDLVVRLEQAPSNSNNGNLRNRRQAALVIRRIKRNLQGQFKFHGFNADQLAGSLLNLLRPHGIEKIVKKTACYGEKVGDIASAAGSLSKLLPYTGFGPNTVGAAEASPGKEKTYLWYATWLYGDKPWNFKEYDRWMSICFKFLLLPYPKDRIYIDNEKQKLIRKRFFEDVKMLGSVRDEKWYEADPINQYSFKPIGPGTMEGFARHFNYSFELFETLLHGFSVESGDWLSNMLYMIYIGGHALFILGANEDPFKSPMLYVRFCLNILGSLPGIHTKAHSTPGFVHWLSQAGANACEAFIFNSVANTLPDAVLSILTLINHKESGKKKNPFENYKETAGLTKLLDLILGLTLYDYIKSELQKEKEYYGFGAFRKKTGHTFGWWWGIGTCFAIFSASLGAFGGQFIARNFDKKLWQKQTLEWLKQLPLSIIMAWAMYWPSYYLGEEGKTDDGKYNPTSDKKFNGYPGKSKSPYKLPFKKGEKVRCHQGNQGIWSHNNFKDDLKAGETPEDIFKYTSLVYAYDFDLDHNEKVPASRGGTVVDFFDWVPDNEEKTVEAPAAELKAGQTSKSNCNFIVIRHDNDPSDSAIDPAAHDKGEEGAKVTTYCVYARGSKGSVRKALGSGEKIGKKVKQGDLIMQAGNTGSGWFNHLHIDVRPGPEPPASSTDKTPVPWAQLEKRTIPFVFKDAEHKAPLEFIFFKFQSQEQDGVPRSLNWYESDNG